MRVRALLALCTSAICIFVSADTLKAYLNPSVDSSDLLAHSIQTLAGNTMPLREVVAGQPSVLAFVAPQCGHCSNELDVVDQLGSLGVQGVRTIVIAEPRGASESELQQFSQTHKVNVLVDRNGLEASLHQNRVPLLVGLDRRGKVTGVVAGERTPDFLLSFYRRTSAGDGGQ